MTLETAAGTTQQTVQTGMTVTCGTLSTKLTGYGSGTGSVSNYDALQNRPQINSITLTGDKTAAQLGITAGGIGAVVAGDALTNQELEALIGGF